MEKLQRFLSDARSIAGLRTATIADTPGLGENLSGFPSRLGAWIAPANREQVFEILSLARRHGLPLYPVSRGRNWGFGSAQPVRHGSIVLDLGRLDSISGYDPREGVVRIEPGVTQEQLSRFLKEQGSPFYLDVTGSGKETSVLGNALDRGIAYNSLRVDQIRNLEVLLGNGDCIRTGFNHYPNARCADLYGHGLGPDLKGLFFQSALGIVLGATLQLRRLPEKTCYIDLKFNHDRLGRVIEAFRELKGKHRLEAIPHIANRERIMAAFGHTLRGMSPEELRAQIKHDWRTVVSISGTRAEVRRFKREGARLLRPAGSYRAFSETFLKFSIRLMRIFPMKSTASLHRALSSMIGFSRGEPSDIAIESFAGSTGEPADGTASPAARVDRSPLGSVYAVPLSPLRLEDADALITLIRGCARTLGLATPEITLNILSHQVLEAVVSLQFDKTRPEETERAHRFLSSLHDALLASGFHPYRLDIENLHRYVDPVDPFWKTVELIKKTLDPDAVISPGRYSAGPGPALPRSSPR